MSEKFRVRVTASKEVTSDEKENLKEMVNNPFDASFEESDKKLSRIQQESLEMKKEEYAAIDFANKVTSEAAERAGVKSFDIPSDRLHIIPTSTYRELFRADSDATAYKHGNAMEIVFSQVAVRHSVLFGKIALHEIMHLKAHETIHAYVNEDDQIVIGRTRDGMSVMTPPNADRDFREHFRGLHEAIVATREKSSFNDMLSLSEFAESKAWRDLPETKELWKDIAHESGIPVDDIAWVTFGEEKRVYYERFSYHTHRQLLHFVCSEIASKHPEKFKNWENVYSLFENAHYNGKLLEIARYVEGVFGKGSFRLLGDMGDDAESAQVCLEKFKVLANATSEKST